LLNQTLFSLDRAHTILETDDNVNETFSIRVRSLNDSYFIADIRPKASAPSMC